MNNIKHKENSLEEKTIKIKEVGFSLPYKIGGKWIKFNSGREPQGHQVKVKGGG